MCGMGTPVLHIVCRLSWLERCVVQLRVLRLRAGVDWGGEREGCAFGGTLLLFGPCWEFIFGVCYGVAVDPCAVVVCYDVRKQFPL